jgi:hypothetical protein
MRPHLLINRSSTGSFQLEAFSYALHVNTSPWFQL